MQQPIHNYENPHLARLKSVAAELVVQEQNGHQSQGVPVDHPLLHGVDKYCDAVLNNKQLAVPDPDAADPDDPDVIAYLVYLHHMRVHAHIADNKEVQTQIDQQLASFKFGNPKWQRMFNQYVKYYWHYPQHTGGNPAYRSWLDPQFGNGDYNYGVIEWQIPADATVALIGDIGTGTDIAAAVLLSALSFKPDVILHVGDVYYSGTKHEFERYFTGLIKTLFADQGVEIPVYTIPGNHEYFSGNVPFFDCIDSNLLVNSEEQCQQASFFKLVTEDDGWQFLAMDTSYHGHYMGVKGEHLTEALKALHVDPDNAYNPVVPPPMVYVRPDEVDWHHYHLSQFQGRTILLSHHQLYSANQKVGVDQNQIDGQPDPQDYNRPGVNTHLWRDFGLYFHKVAAWFWGHEHNLGIYQSNYRPEGWPAPTEAVDDPWKNLAKGRCVGHSAIPVKDKETPYKVNYPVPLEDESLKLDLYQGWYNRGFEILKLNGAGQPVQVSYYQVQGADPKPRQIYEETIE